MTSNKWKKEFLPEHCVSSVEIFDPVEQSWMSGPELPSALCGAGKCALCGLYAGLVNCGVL